MRPDAGGGATLRFAVAGIDDKHLVHLAVAVPVVVGKVHLLIGQLAGFHNHLDGVLRITARIVLAVVRHIFRNRDGAHHVEGEVQLSVGLLLEVVVYAAGVAVSRVVLLVHHLVEHLVGVSAGHLHVLEVDEDDQSLAVARDGGAFAHGACCRRAQCGVGSCRPHGIEAGGFGGVERLQVGQLRGVQADEVRFLRAAQCSLVRHAARGEQHIVAETGIFKATVVQPHQGYAVERLEKMERLVAREDDGQHGAVRLP